jgi:capsular polysaccharide biosynthesis protein
MADVPTSAAPSASASAGYPLSSVSSPPPSGHRHSPPASGHVDSPRPSGHSDSQLTLGDYLRPARRWWWAIVALTLLATAGTYFYYRHQPPHYASATELYVQSADASLTNLGAGAPTPQSEERSVLDIATLTRSLTVAALAKRELGSATPATVLAGEIDATPVSGSDFLTITAHGGTAAETAALADAFAHALIAVQSGESRKQLQNAIRQTKLDLAAVRGPQSAAQRATIELQLQQLQLQLSVPPLTIEQISPAAVPTLPESPRPKRNAAFAFALALLLGVVGAYALSGRGAGEERSIAST